MTVPAAVTAGTSYTVYLCEVNATPYPSPASATVCGTSASFIDASFTFAATAKTLSQNLPVTGTVTAASSTSFTAQLASSGNTGTVTYTQTAGSASVVVSNSGAVSTKGALAPGTYTASGTTADPNGDAGTFTYTLTVTGTSVTPPPTVVKPPRATRVVGWGIVGRTTIVTDYRHRLHGRSSDHRARGRCCLGRAHHEHPNHRPSARREHGEEGFVPLHHPVP